MFCELYVHAAHRSDSSFYSLRTEAGIIIIKCVLGLIAVTICLKYMTCIGTVCDDDTISCCISGRALSVGLHPPSAPIGDDVQTKTQPWSKGVQRSTGPLMDAHKHHPRGGNLDSAITI